MIQKKKKKNKAREQKKKEKKKQLPISPSLPPRFKRPFPFLDANREKGNPSGRIVANKSAGSQRDAFDFVESRRRAEPSRAEPSARACVGNSADALCIYCFTYLVGNYFCQRNDFQPPRYLRNAIGLIYRPADVFLGPVCRYPCTCPPLPPPSNHDLLGKIPRSNLSLSLSFIERSSSLTYARGCKRLEIKHEKLKIERIRIGNECSMNLGIRAANNDLKEKIESVTK